MDIKENMLNHNKYLGKYATKDSAAIYLRDINEDIRTPFFRDIDRIIYTLAYSRYTDKTQVFSYKNNDHITKRMMHIQYVSKIARTIGRALSLNEDLIEAAGLGHDLGHTPFGHVGEAILSEISQNNGEGYFNHNIHSVRLLMEIEDYGKGKNITLQTLDAIMCHNGEFVAGMYKPKEKTIDEFLLEYHNSYQDKEQIKKLVVEAVLNDEKLVIGGVRGDICALNKDGNHPLEDYLRKEEEKLAETARKNREIKPLSKDGRPSVREELRRGKSFMERAKRQSMIKQARLKQEQAK